MSDPGCGAGTNAQVAWKGAHHPAGAVNDSVLTDQRIDDKTLGVVESMVIRAVLR
jgi:hypothetical protein